MSFARVLRIHQQVNALSHSLIGRPAFEEMHVIIPDSSSPEPGFIHATSWLYCLYFEAGRVSLTFLRRLGEAYGLIERSNADEHIEVVRCLRTELHHNLGFADTDQAARTVAQSWRRKVCGTAIPREDGHWCKCYDCLVDTAYGFLNSIDQVVRRIEADGDRSAMQIDDWLRRLERNWSVAAFDRLVDDTKYRIGRDTMNTVSFRNRHIDRWRKQLDLLEDDFDFEDEATRLIEKTLLDEDSIVLPVTGRDVMDALELTPGKRVGYYLEEARKIFESAPCSREELLTHLRGLEQGF